MTIENNRRLQEVKKDILKYQKRLKESETISESLIYQGKIESLENEKQKILARYDEK